MIRARNKGFSFLELVTSLFIVCIMTIAMTMIYQSSRTAIAAVDKRLEEGFFSSEIMQLLVEDISRACADDDDTSLKLNSKNVGGADVYRLEIASRIYDNNGSEVIYRKIIWQSEYDFDTRTFTLYRYAGGMMVEDPILSTQARQNPGRQIFVPVCEGLTHFTIQVPRVQDTAQGQVVNYEHEWERDEMPGGLVIDLSFAEPVEYITGEIEVPIEDRLIQTIAVNRSREYRFQFVPKNLEDEYGEFEMEEDFIEDEDFYEENGESDDESSDD